MQALHKWKGIRLKVAEYCRDNQISKEEINEALEPIDYYITDKKFKWLITENHHAYVKFIGEGLDVNKIKEVCSIPDGNGLCLVYSKEYVGTKEEEKLKHILDEAAKTFGKK